MAKKNKTTLDDLIDEALENVREDRKKTLDAYEKMKISLNAEDKATTSLLGDTAVKLLDSLTRGNEQVVKMAQIKERQESKSNKNEKRQPLDLAELSNIFDSEDEDDGDEDLKN